MHQFYSYLSLLILLNLDSILFFLPTILTVPKFRWSGLFSILRFPSSNSDPLQSRALHLDLPLGDSSTFFNPRPFQYPVNFFANRSGRPHNFHFQTISWSLLLSDLSQWKRNIQKYKLGRVHKPRWRSSTEGSDANVHAMHIYTCNLGWGYHIILS